MDLEFKTLLEFNEIFPALVIHIKYLIDSQAIVTTNDNITSL